MSYSANNYNYATPLSSASGLLNETSTVKDIKYFTLADNKLDGSYYPISGDVGLWGAALPDANGVLAEPFVVTIEDALTVNAIRIVGSQHAFPVSFTLQFYNGEDLLYAVTETSNDSTEYVHYLPYTAEITHYRIVVTKVSSATSPVRLFNAYNPAYIKRVDTLVTSTTGRGITDSDNKLYELVDTVKVKTVESSAVNASITSADTVRAKTAGSSAIRNTANAKDSLVVTLPAGIPSIHNTINVTRDELSIRHDEVTTPTNVHTRMKEPYRHIPGKVYITYTDPMLASEVAVETSSSAYNSNPLQVLDGVSESDSKFFTLYDNDLSGKYVLSDSSSQVGWTSAELSDENGFFENPPSITVNLSSRPLTSLMVSFDNTRNNFARDFTVTLEQEDGNSVVRTFTDNELMQVPVIDAAVADVVAITITITRISKPYSPAVVLDMPVSSTVLYRGYDDASDLMSIDLLEELTYEDDVEALGGVSANEITVVLDNSNKDFFFNSGSLVSKQLKRNRKIVPWLGVEIVPGEIEWYELGTFWSYRWNVPVNGLTTTVVGFDTIGLLSLTDYHEHQVQVNKSLGELIEYVLDDAKRQLDFIEYTIDPSLYNVVIPYAWFEHGSHAAALRKISLCYPMHIYCDRQGRICAATQKLRLDYYKDVWSDSTNVIDKDYDSLYTTLPNVVNVEVVSPVLHDNEQLVDSQVPFLVNGSDLRTFAFSSPYVDNIVVSIDCDDTVFYDYSVYSWGIDITFTGSGNVRSIMCIGTIVDTSARTVVSKKDAESVRLNGSVTRDVRSDFIQTASLANYILDRLFALSENDKYDASVKYRGDIALSINDPILLENGIAPDNRYNIKRHQLSWSGFLTGSAELNT